MHTAMRSRGAVECSCGWRPKRNGNDRKLSICCSDTKPLRSSSSARKRTAKDSFGCSCACA